MRVTVHLGAHRAGMAGVMQGLMANRGALSGAGVAVWPPEAMRQGLGGGLVRRPERVTLAEEKRGRRAVGRMRLRQALLERDGTHRLLVIGPDLLGRPADCLRRAALYPLAGERLLRSAPAFVERCDRVTLALWRPDRWWAAALAEAVAAGLPLPNRDQLDRIVTHPRSWRHVIRDVAAMLPQARLLVWPGEVWQEMPEHQIAAMIGDTPGRLSPYRGQPAPPPDADQLERLLTQRGAPAVLRRTSAGQWAPFDEAQTEALAAQYQDDLAWLAAGAAGRATVIGPQTTDRPPHVIDRPAASGAPPVPEAPGARSGSTAPHAIRQQGANRNDPNALSQSLG